MGKSLKDFLNPPVSLRQPTADDLALAALLNGELVSAAASTPVPQFPARAFTREEARNRLRNEGRSAAIGLKREAPERRQTDRGMTMLNEIDALNGMTAADFESMTVGVRHVLAGRVLRYFSDMDGWDAEVERGSEYGGLFPVTVILTPLFTQEYQVMINCPGIEGEGDNWSIVQSYDDGRLADMLYSHVQFQPDVMREHVLRCRGQSATQ